MKNYLFLLISLALACAKTEPQNVLLSNETAQDTAHQVFVAAGGDKLSDVAQLNFTFIYYQGESKVFEAVHKFDRKNYRARVTWTNRAGNRNDAILDLKTKTGKGTIDGAPVLSEALAELLSKAHARWINDAYWLLMPLKLRDPGVKLEREDNRKVGDLEYQILKMTFGGVGLTPGDTYWLYINPKNHRIERWDMMLQGQSNVEPVTWEDYRAVGPLWLAFDHKEAEGRVVFEGVAALPQVNEGDFQ